MSNSQDTTRIDSIKEYTSSEYPVKNKIFYGKLEYGREVIVFNDTHKEVDYCYYYDGERICNEFEYFFVNDSTLYIGDTLNENSEKWNYHVRDNGKYDIIKTKGKVVEIGHASSIFPLIKEGISTIKYGVEDTLWYEDYSNVDFRKPYDFPEYTYYKTSKNYKPYKYFEIDSFPTFKNGDSLNFINMKYYSLAPSRDFRKIACQSDFIITKDGHIKNIETNLSYPDERIALILKLKELEPFSPAIKNGEPVDCHWIIFVFIEQQINPGYDIYDLREVFYNDNKKKRK